MIRKATPSDNKQIAKLYYLIWKDMELDIVKEISKKRMINLLELSIVNVHYRTYYKNIWVYEKIMRWPVVLSLMMVRKKWSMKNNGTNCLLKKISD